MGSGFGEGLMPGANRGQLAEGPQGTVCRSPASDVRRMDQAIQIQVIAEALGPALLLLLLLMLFLPPWAALASRLPCSEGSKVRDKGASTPPPPRLLPLFSGHRHLNSGSNTFER